MKKLIVFALLAIVSFGCSSSDDSVSVTEEKLVGKWYYSTTKVAGQTFPYDDHEDCGKDYVEFKADGTLFDVDVWDCEVYDDLVGTWTIDGNKIVIASFGEVLTGTVKKLNANTLVVSTKYDFFENGQEITVVETYTRN